MKTNIQKKISIFLFIVIIPLTMRASFEGDTWIRTTLGGNNFHHERCCHGNNRSYSYNISCSNKNKDTTIIKDKNGYIIQNLTKWYFYKKHIIGEYYPIKYNKRKLKYFIFDECSCKLREIETKQEFEDLLQKEKLKPLITRSYRESWGMLIRGDDTIADFLFFLIIKLPLLIIFLIVSVVTLVKNKMDFKLLKVKFFTIMSIILLIRCLLDLYPNSF